MIDKTLVKKRFSDSLETYDDNAFVQKEMANKLVSMLDKKEYESILEVGCATGILTKKIKDELVFKNFVANDLVESAQSYINEIVEDSEFIAGDIEDLKLDKNYDLIISNACLQWCNNLTKTIDKLYDSLSENGILAFSIFGEENLIEIQSLFDIENKTYSVVGLREHLKKYALTQYCEEKSKLYFDGLIDVLKHLKHTGVNALTTYKLTKNKIKTIEEKYSKLYAQNGKISLTYNPIFIVIKKSK